MKNILIIDGQGGKIGRALIEKLLDSGKPLSVTAVGTNSIATANMLKAGPIRAATGENSIVAACRKADIIAGPVGIVMVDAMLGEITARAAAAVACADAVRLLIPMNSMPCETTIIGVRDLPLGTMIAMAAEEIAALTEEGQS
ncbi:MAG: DUF3842 family protein [Clostridia bacterium]|nr:DUF3842 family protein [Clostridia bacterium]